MLCCAVSGRVLGVVVLLTMFDGVVTGADVCVCVREREVHF